VIKFFAVICEMLNVKNNPSWIPLWGHHSASLSLWQRIFGQWPWRN